MYQLRKYQREAVDATLGYFRKKRDPAVIVLPTGAGKSLVIAELARIARGRVLVLAHVKELVEQNHLKYESYDLMAGIYSAGLHKKESQHKVIFGSIQSVANAEDSFLNDFTLLVVDECHRIGLDAGSQYGQVIQKIREKNPQICILGLTATPYRLGMGWIYNTSHRGAVQTNQERFFKHCVYELPLAYMIKNHYLVPPVRVDIPVTCYDFSELALSKGTYTWSQVEETLKEQRKLTPLIVGNIVDITEKYERQGVLIFSSTVRHAQEILTSLPKGQAQIVVGETHTTERDQIIRRFKNKDFKYLVNVSVLTTGFDAPHVDVIALMRPTESVSLYQQIIGRGLRLAQSKKDCLVLDYTGMSYDIYAPEISDKKPTKDAVLVKVLCPQCNFENDFWGVLDQDGDVIEHYGRKCRGARGESHLAGTVNRTTGKQDPHTFEFTPCGYRFRFKICDQCETENDITAQECCHCGNVLVNASTRLKQARLSKNAHVLRPEHVELLERQDKRGSPFLEVKYYDCDAQCLSEVHYLSSQTDRKKFNINFLRSHLKRPEKCVNLKTPADVLRIQKQLRMPSFVVARKQKHFWKITEKIFVEEFF